MEIFNSFQRFCSCFKVDEKNRRKRNYLCIFSVEVCVTIGQSSWLRLSVLPHFLRSNVSATGPLSIVSTIEGLLGRKNRGSGLEIRGYGRRDPSY
jgi:hypothetical protein